MHFRLLFHTCICPERTEVTERGDKASWALVPNRREPHQAAMLHQESYEHSALTLSHSGQSYPSHRSNMSQILLSVSLLAPGCIQYSTALGATDGPRMVPDKGLLRTLMMVSGASTSTHTPGCTNCFNPNRVLHTANTRKVPNFSDCV